MSLSSAIHLPDILRMRIAEYLPGLGDPDEVEFRICRRIPFRWIHWRKDLAGLTLWTRVYLRSEDDYIEPANRHTIELIFHELIHVLQFRKHPILFPIKYLLDHFRYGYHLNPAEVEARRRAAHLVKTFFDEAQKNDR